MPSRDAPDHGDEQGSVLVLVLIISFLLVSSLAVGLTTSQSSLSVASQYGRSVQSMLASRSGIDAEITAIRSATTYTSLPCGLTGNLSVPGALSSYAVTVQYTAGATVLSCAGATLGGTVVPTAAAVVSTGHAAHGSATLMQANLSISASATVLSQALGYAIFTNSNLSLTNAATVNQVGSNPPPNIYAGNTLTCANGTASQGNLVTYAPVTLSAACSFTGSLTANGAVTMGNSAHVGGAVIAYGGGITMTGNSSIAGNATATGGTISLSNSGSVGGNADASAAITVSGGSTLGGTETANDPTLASQTMPAQVTFPGVDTTAADWTAAGWNVVQIPSATYPNCENLTNSTTTSQSYFQNLSSGASDPFMSQMTGATAKTLIYAPTCAVTYSGAHVFTLGADVALMVQSLTLSNSNAFYSTSTTAHNFSILASAASACNSTVDVTFGNSVSFTSPTPSTNATLNTLIYTQGAANYANAPSMTGQILACGGFTGENGFVLNFVPTAATTLPWTSTTTTPPTVTVLQKFVLHG